MTTVNIENSKIHILILDDQPMWQVTTKEMCTDILLSIFSNDSTDLKKNKAQFFIASTVDQAKEILNENQIHLFLLDKDLGVDKSGQKISGVDHIQEFKSIQPFCQILMLTADNAVKDIAQAMRNGASDYLFKNDDDGQKEYRLEIIKKVLALHADQISKAKQVMTVNRGLYSNYVCKSPAMQRLDNKLLAVSESTRPILLLGATGLGKGAVARRISDLRKKSSEKPTREFVQLNIGSTEKNLVESLLFGTEPGAFTDASKQTKAGLLDIARDGDIFLDEIGDASLDLQLKLLKAVEEKEYYRVGGNKPIKTNARFIFATNKDIHSLIADGKFREDFYMRISVFEETLPPLNERKQDVPLIVDGFLQNACANFKNKKMTIEDFPDDLMQYFFRDEIHGNIRGIENDVERLVAHAIYDETGKPELQSWKKILGQSAQNYSRKPQVLTVDQLLNAKTHFLDKNFPGMWEITQILEKRILEEIEEKGLSIEQAAKVLKVSANTVWSRKKQFSAQSKERI